MKSTHINLQNTSVYWKKPLDLFTRPVPVQPSAGLGLAGAGTLQTLRFGGRNTDPVLKPVFVKTISGGSFPPLQVFHLVNPKKPKDRPQVVYAICQPKTGLTTMGYIITAGSARETPDISGIFHFLEHLVFKGTLDGKGNLYFKPGQLDQEFRKRLTENNADTWYDATRYFAYDSPRRHTQSNLKNLAMMVQGPALLKKEVDNERGTVIEEIALYQQELNWRLFDQAMADLYGYMPILGSRQVIETIPIERIRQVFLEHYGPENRKALVIGDFQPSKVLPLLAETMRAGLNRFPKTAPAVKEPDFVTPSRPPVRRTMVSNTLEPDQARVWWAFRGPKPYDARASLAFDLLNKLIGGSESAYGVQQLEEAERLVTRLESDTTPLAQGNLLIMDMTTNRKQLVQLQQRLKQILSNPETLLADEKRLLRAKNVMIREYEEKTQSQYGLFDVVSNQVLYNTVDRLYGDNYVKVLQPIRPDEVLAVARTFLKPQSRVEYVITAPKKAKQTRSGEGPRFSGALAPGEKRVDGIPGGAELIVNPLPQARRTAVTVAIPGGRCAERHPGESDFLAQMLARQTRHRDQQAMAEYLDEHRLDLDIRTHEDVLFITMTASRDKYREMMTLLQEILLAPAFDAEGLAWEKTKVVEDVKNALAASADFDGKVAAVENFYPTPQHPYAVTAKSLLSTAGKITPKRLRTLYNTLFQPQQMTFVVAGPVSPAQVKQDVSVISQGLSRLNTGKPRLRPAQNPVFRQSVVVTQTRDNDPDFQQAQVYRAYPAPGLNHPDRPAMETLEMMLNGISGLDGILMNTFRGVSEGLCYSAYSRYTPLKEGGRFELYIGTSHQNIKKVLTLLDQVVREQLIDKPRTRKEIRLMQQAMKKNLLVKAFSPLLQSMSTASHRALDFASRQEIIGEIDNLTPQRLQAVAKQYLGAPFKDIVLTTSKAAAGQGLVPNGATPYHTWIDRSNPT